MGSCYSTPKSSIGKRSETVGADSTTATGAVGGGGEGPVPTTPPAVSSPPKPRTRRHHQRHGSGRWRRKRSGGDDGSIWGSDGVEIPGRLCTNGSSRSACLYTQQGKKGTNQDAMLVWENFGSAADATFCGVFDGHGPFGHLVARKVRDSLPLILSTRWRPGPHGSPASPTDDDDDDQDEPSDDEKIDGNDDDRKDFPEMYGPIRRSMLKAFKLMDKELKLHPTVDCYCSGTTAVALVKQGQHLVIGNVGDSRAVLATRDGDGNLAAVQLTVDLKPDLPKEAARIHRCKGRVFALQDEPEVARVWLPNSDSPGLAMARAFGDFCLKDFGLISVPDVYYHRVGERDEFVILATDGVWDVLSNKEAVEIVASAPGPATAARALVDCAVRAWRLKYPTSKNDDCAVVCLFLERRTRSEENGNCSPGAQIAVDRSGTSFEIVPVDDDKVNIDDNKVAVKSESKRSLAEFISAEDDDEEWSALEGVTRVNSLLSLPRFFSGDKRSASWRKWL